jgi:hypothetical protein
MEHRTHQSAVIAFVDVCILQRLIDLQGDDSTTETKQDKPKQDDPVVDLFPDDDAEERNSKSPELFFRGRRYLKVVRYFVLICHCIFSI